MADNTKISWATHTFNPWLGCCHAMMPGANEPHPGCQNCYACAMSGKWGVAWGPASEGGTRRRTAEATWKQVERWNRQAACRCGELEFDGGTCTACLHGAPRVFPSACDPFENWEGHVLESAEMPLVVPRKGGKMFGCHHGPGTAERYATLADVRRDFFSLIDRTPNLDWLLLTKRPQNVRRMWRESFNPELLDGAGDDVPLRRENVWLLYSASDQRSLEAGLPHLLECRDLVPVIGLSLEPLVGPIDLRFVGGSQMETPYRLRGSFWDVACENHCDFAGWEDDLVPDPEQSEADADKTGTRWVCPKCHSDSALVERNDDDPGIDWVIVGGESGPHARPCKVEWIRDIVDQCRAAGVPCFVKQDSGRFPGQQGRIPDDLWSVKEFPSG